LISVVDYFDNMAPVWDTKIKIDYSLIKKVIGKTDKNLFSTILDIGCGTGNLFPMLLARLKEDGLLYGLDPSRQMLKRASSKFTDPRIRLIEAFSENIPLQDETIELITVFSCFPHLRNKKVCLREWFRVLVPKGIALIFHTQGRENINNIHRTLPAPINDHILEPASFVAKEALEKGFSVLETRDDENLYLVLLQKP